jgi:hypothetical protein
MAFLKEVVNMKCEICKQEIEPLCDWQQGRCPHRQPMLTDYHFRFYNLLHAIKNLFKK